MRGDLLEDLVRVLKIALYERISRADYLSIVQFMNLVLTVYGRNELRERLPGLMEAYGLPRDFDPFFFGRGLKHAFRLGEVDNRSVRRILMRHVESE